MHRDRIHTRTGYYPVPTILCYTASIERTSIKGCAFYFMYIYTPRRVKYHDRKLQRLQHYNYSSPGSYFVTICVRFMVEWFGNVVDKKMILNDYGKIAAHYWQNIPKHYSNVSIDQWVIMPNHIHGIVVIHDAVVGTEYYSVPTHNGIHDRYGLVSKIIKSFKHTVTHDIRTKLHNHQFAWQRSFHDHVIRNQQELHAVRKYIMDNPKNWTP